MFSIELKFTVDCLKAWFQKNHKILDVDIDQKLEFIRKKSYKKDAFFCLSDFPIDPRIKKWMVRSHDKS